MTQGGDARILLDEKSGLNRYFSAPYPRDVLAFASSTANDLSPEAGAYLDAQFGSKFVELDKAAEYCRFLSDARQSIRRSYDLPGDTPVFFAPSGTDLEYVALLAVAGRSANGIANLLLGADEVGSGCIHSAAGLFFAHETALEVSVSPGQPVTGLPPIEMGDFPVRNADGDAFESAAITAQMEISIEAAIAKGLYPLVHVVHGSKTGLVLPHLDDIDRLQSRFGDQVAFVVDACQARITTSAIREYLARDIIVFLTGSKFMGGPPFSGFALVPQAFIDRAAPVAAGMADIFRRGEIPADWPGRDVCLDSGNAGLALRLAASLFELEQFQNLPIARVQRVVDCFGKATDRLAVALRVRKVASASAEDAAEPVSHPIEMRTLVTLDLCHDASGTQSRHLNFDDAARIHKGLIAHDIRLGQPVKCVKMPDGSWGATLRIGLSMPQISRLDRVSDAAMQLWFDEAMDRLERAFQAELGSTGRF
jgi:hypothetical protein